MCLACALVLHSGLNELVRLAVAVTLVIRSMATETHSACLYNTLYFVAPQLTTPSSRGSQRPDRSWSCKHSAPRR